MTHSSLQEIEILRMTAAPTASGLSELSHHSGLTDCWCCQGEPHVIPGQDTGSQVVTITRCQCYGGLQGPALSLVSRQQCRPLIGWECPGRGAGPWATIVTPHTLLPGSLLPALRSQQLILCTQHHAPRLINWSLLLSRSGQGYNLTSFVLLVNQWNKIGKDVMYNDIKMVQLSAGWKVYIFLCSSSHWALVLVQVNFRVGSTYLRKELT